MLEKSCKPKTNSKTSKPKTLTQSKDIKKKMCVYQFKTHKKLMGKIPPYAYNLCKLLTFRDRFACGALERLRIHVK